MPRLGHRDQRGFGTYHYRYASGREGDSALARMGPHKTGEGGLYLKRLGDVDQDALRELIDRSVRVRKGVDRAST